MVVSDANRPAAVASRAPAEAAHLSIVVLPFTNLSNDPAQDYFADGITENLTTDLSRIRNSFVIARNTAFTFKGKNVDAKEIGKELGVRYVLEGSVQRDGNRVRVNAQLIDARIRRASLGRPLRGRRRPTCSSCRIRWWRDWPIRLGYELVKAEAEKGARSKNPDAIDLAMRGQALLQQATRYEGQQRRGARACSSKRSRPTPTMPMRWRATLAPICSTMPSDGQIPRPTTMRKYSRRPTGPLRSLPITGGRITRSALTCTLSHRANEALRAADAGSRHQSKFCPALLSARASPKLSLGRFEQAKSDLRQAMRLSPRDPKMGLWHFADRQMRNSDRAISTPRSTNSTRQSKPVFDRFIPYADLAAAYALEGKMDEAKSALAEAHPPQAQISRSNGQLPIRRTCRTCSTACARRGCRRNEASLKAACWSGRDARRLSTAGLSALEGHYEGRSGRAIRADAIRQRGRDDRQGALQSPLHRLTETGTCGFVRGPRFLIGSAYSMSRDRW